MKELVALTPVAHSTPFDPETSELVSQDVNAAILEVYANVNASASPGFTWGRSGNVPTSTYLLNDTVPSSTTGRTVPVDGELVEMFLAIENANACTFTIQKRIAGTWTDFLSGSLLATERIKNISFAAANSVSKGDELAVYISAGSARNPVVGVIITGSYTTP